VANKKLKILYVSPEVVPFAKTGGLADVAGSLTKAFEPLGHDIRVIMPKYEGVSEEKYEMKEVIKGLEVEVGGGKEVVDILETKIPGTDVPVYLVSNYKYFGSRKELYQVKGKDYEDNCERFSLFSKAVLLFIKKIGWQPDIVHCNDWQSALVIPYLKILYKGDPYFAKTATIYSIHNMAYHGLFPKEKIFTIGLSWNQFTPDTLEFYGNLALTKAGFVYADLINTVSETYSKEIQTPEYGYGLDGLLRHRSADVFGILNGLDYDLWDPAKDKIIVKKYSIKDISGKLDNKLALQKENGLPEKPEIPLIGMITRLDIQKGLDILAGIIEDIMHLKCQIIILGTGDPKYHKLLQDERKKYPDHIAVNLGFDAALAQRIYAGSDMFLMPSKYEPCGLGQLISFKYGTIPIVRATGGLADTVHDFDPATGYGDGFVFKEYTSAALLHSIKAAIKTFSDKKKWEKLMKKAMAYDYSWGASAKKYIELYRKALSKIRA